MGQGEVMGRAVNHVLHSSDAPELQGGADSQSSNRTGGKSRLVRDPEPTEKTGSDERRGEHSSACEYLRGGSFLFFLR